jgi:hypothetical protein
MDKVGNPETIGTKKSAGNWRETLMNKPGLFGGGAIGIGAVLGFLLNATVENERQDTAILDAVSAQTTQLTNFGENLDGLRSDVQQIGDRTTKLEMRTNELTMELRQQEREQQQLESGQHKLRGDVQEWLRHRVGYQHIPSGGYVAEVAQEILAIIKEGAQDVWIERGPPYVDTDVLSRRMNRRVSADERDQAAALLQAAKTLSK